MKDAWLISQIKFGGVNLAKALTTLFNQYPAAEEFLEKEL